MQIIGYLADGCP